jgi:hypothetical protein
MNRRKKFATVVVTLAIAMSVAPAAAAARSFSYPAYDPGMSVSVTGSDDVSYDVVSWGD